MIKATVVKPEVAVLQKAPVKKISKQELVDAYEVIVDYLKGNTQAEDNKANFAGSATRAAKALTEMCRPDTEIKSEITSILKKSFPITRTAGHSAGMITQGPITVNSLCPHHLLPVRYHAFVSYVPTRTGHVLGLSKLSRIAKVLGQRPILQEKLASDIADVLYQGEYKHTQFNQIISDGSAVTLVGIHNCMTCRGVSESAKTVTTEIRGIYVNSDLEQKFYTAINHAQTMHPFE